MPLLISGLDRGGEGGGGKDDINGTLRGPKAGKQRGTIEMSRYLPRYLESYLGGLHQIAGDQIGRSSRSITVYFGRQPT